MRQHGHAARPCLAEGTRGSAVPWACLGELSEVWGSNMWLSTSGTPSFVRPTSFENKMHQHRESHYPRRHPEFSALSKNLAIILLNNGATTCDMKTSSVFARIKFLEGLEELFWPRQKLTYILAREQKYSYLFGSKVTRKLRVASGVTAYNQLIRS